MKVGKTEIMYVCVTDRNEVNHDTLRYYRKDSIKKLVEDGNMTWKELRKYGWRCIKVTVEINHSSNT